MTEYAGKFMVGDGVPAWVVPVTFQDGRCVVDTTDDDDLGLTHAYDALAASGEPLWGGPAHTLGLILADAYDGFSDPEIISIRWVGDALIIFCSRRQMEKTQIEVWQRQCADWVHKRNRPPAIEQDRRAEKAEAAAEWKERRSLQAAEAELWKMMKHYGKEKVCSWDWWNTYTWSSSFAPALCLYMNDHPKLDLAALKERVALVLLKAPELKALCKARGIKAGPTKPAMIQALRKEMP
jgi:hypothetical protein